MNVSKLHREDLLNKIQQIRTYIASAQQDQNTGNLLQYLDELVKDVKGKKYGLVFEQHREAIDETLETHVPVLTEQPDLFIDNGGQMNFLIEGDNLASLQLLEKTHKGKIDVIYIDPPYNTGKNEKDDFHYDDKFVDINDTFRHSKWLSFMEKRLLIAKNLLSRKGVIFISIDDNEQANLKILCDEVFRENFIAQMIWQQGKKSSGNLIGVNHEYMLVYAKNRSTIDKPEFAWKQRKEGLDKIYKKYNQLKKKYKEDTTTIEIEMKQWFNSLPENDPAYNSKHYCQVDSKGLFFADNSCAPDRPETRCHKPLIHPITHKETAVPSLGWRWKESTLDKMVQDDIIYYGENETCVPKVKKYLTDMESELPSSVFYKDGRGASAELEKILGGKKFNNPKDKDEIARILNFRKNTIILDFFAGSGTTGHAVMKLNAEDGGKRRFILCTNNENNICRDVTYERLKTVITGKRKDGSEYSEKYPASLKYYKVDFVPITDKVYYDYADELLLHVRELVELENGINFTGNSEIAIVLTEDEMAQFVAQDDVQAKTLYRGHNVLLTAEQEAFIAAHGIHVHVIPDYYYNEMTK